jgi:hypothetical protein
MATRLSITGVLRHDPYDIRRQSVRLHARRQPSADVDLDIEVLVGGRPVAPQLIDDLPALIVVHHGRGRLAVRLIRSLAGLLARRGVARPGRLLLRGRARGLGRLVALILAIAIHLLLGLLLGIGGLIRGLRAVLLGLIFAASQLLLGLLLLVGRLLRVATVLPVLLLRRARGRALAAGLGGLILTLPGRLLRLFAALRRRRRLAALHLLGSAFLLGLSALFHAISRGRAIHFL